MHKKIFGLILIDQITKLFFWPRDFFLLKADQLLTGLFQIHFHPVKNFGLAFSVNFGTLTNILILSAAILFFVYYYLKNNLRASGAGNMVFILIIAGAISNIIDRLYLGYVRDFIDLGLGFTFNLADVFIAVGLIGILISRNKTDELL